MNSPFPIRFRWPVSRMEGASQITDDEFAATPGEAEAQAASRHRRSVDVHVVPGARPYSCSIGGRPALVDDRTDPEYDRIQDALARVTGHILSVAA